MFKDKDKLTSYRRLIEQRMEQFKDIERENKTKPHSKQVIWNYDNLKKSMGRVKKHFIACYFVKFTKCENC